MLHAIKEHHIDDICSNCKKPHTNKQIEILMQHHKIYEAITCNNCGYKMLRLKDEPLFNDRFQFM